MIQSKLPNTSISIFAVMTALANEQNAINLSQGFPDFEVDDVLIDLVNYHMKKGHNQYAPMPGLPKLREQIAIDLLEKYTYKANLDEITVFSGATEALFVSIQTLVNQGDEVIVFDPAYDSYDPAITLAGGIPIHLNLNSDFTYNWRNVEENIGPKTKLIIINSPHNPTGSTIKAEDLDNLYSIIKYRDIWVLSDEVYHKIIFDGKHHSVLTHEKLREKSIAVFSFGKTFHATGWKLGYAFAPEKITRELRKIHQFVTYSVNTPVQFAIADYLKMNNKGNTLGTFFNEKRKSFIEQIRNKNFDILPCFGTYFQLVKYTGEYAETDLEFAKKMTSQYKIATIPISVFYKNKKDEHIFRICFAKNNKTLTKGAQYLNQIP